MSHASKRRQLTIALTFIFITLVLLQDIIASAAPSLASQPLLTSSSNAIATAAYAVSITQCGRNVQMVFDAAAVLKRSIELNSWPLHSKSRYAAKFYAFTLNPENASEPALVDHCHQLLSLAGWTVLPQDPPVHIGLIEMPEGSILRSQIAGDGCCGHNEFIKLSAYKLINHEFALHLDLDTLVIHPLDELFDVMHFGPDTEEGKNARLGLVDVVAPTYLNRRMTGNPSKSGNMSTSELLMNITVDAFFTKDYNMIVPGKHEQRVGIQGGFLLVRPSMTTYGHLLSLVYSGEFYGGFDAKESGWFKSGYGKHIWGSMTIQGLMAYFFDVKKLNHSVELNRCRYNNIADNSRVSTYSSKPKFPRGTLLPFLRNASNPQLNFHDTMCRDGRDECDDTNCQRFPLQKARILHYTYCKSPWSCSRCDFLQTYREPMCYSMAREWFRVRSTIPGEDNPDVGKVKGGDYGPISHIHENGEVSVTQGNCYKEYYLGYCLDKGEYQQIKPHHLFIKRDNHSLTNLQK
ncbi:hypothetical protein ACHAW6_010010 [Cyclotella cf. meneghiniana]